MVFNAVEVGFIRVTDVEVGLPSQWVVGRFGEVLVDRTDLFRDVGKGFVEEVGAVVHDFFKGLFCFPVDTACVVEILFRGAKLRLHRFETVDSAHVGCHLVEVAVKGADAFLKL